MDCTERARPPAPAGARRRKSLTVRERIAQELLEQLLLPMGLMGLVLSAHWCMPVCCAACNPSSCWKRRLSGLASAATTQQTRYRPLN